MRAGSPATFINSTLAVFTNVFVRAAEAPALTNVLFVSAKLEGWLGQPPCPYRGFSAVPKNEFCSSGHIRGSIHTII
jgi:hypothetical protein